ncbi:MAG TPA: hypothetical protein VEY88_24615 [Archangium sp.]|nr:hypothetical protein [Archangium sp.]
MGLGCLCTFLGVALSDFGQLGPTTDAVQSAWLLPLYFGSVFLLTAAGLTTAFRRQQHAALPFPPGRYFLPFGFIGAHSRHLRIVPLDEIDDFKAVHEHVNDAYSHTVFTFFLEDGECETWQPEGTVLYEAVRENLATLLAEASEVGRGLPRYVERDFARYLECGVLAHGFASRGCAARVERTNCSSPSRARDEGCAPPVARSGRM